MAPRTTIKYHKTKSDPICKWRTASPDTVVELVKELPKTKMKNERFRDIMNGSRFGLSFLRTAYQLAEQMALYYIDEETDEYIPRFNHDVTRQEAWDYLIDWARKYYVPNPYTKRGFVNVIPSIHLFNGIADYLDNHPNKPNLATAGAALFGGEMGNIGSVKYLIKEYSNIIDIDTNNDMTLLATNYGPVDAPNDRDDKKAFFNYF